jgi:drug/metabolite transporter (DMT)-like permease
MLIPKVSHVTLAMGVWIGFTASIANVAFLLLLSLLGSTRVSIVYMLQRPLVVLLAAPILHEPLHWYQILGIALVFYGVHLAKVEKTVSVQASTSCGEAKLDSNGRDVRDMASSGKR